MISMQQIDFAKGNGLVPAVVQDSSTRKVLMVGYMNEQALAVTKQTGKVTFWSRSKDRLWTKGETSGNYLNLRSIEVDCDSDCLLVYADPVGPTCHTGADTCFQEKNDKDSVLFLQELYDVISERRDNPSDASYTSSLFAKGINKIAQKVGEEAVELVIEAKDENDDLFKNEAADLIYHLLVLLKAKNFTPGDIIAVLKERHRPK